jgi:hypothetical protein
MTAWEDGYKAVSNCPVVSVSSTVRVVHLASGTCGQHTLLRKDVDCVPLNVHCIEKVQRTWVICC